MKFNYEEYFERRPELCGGALVVKGTRVPVRTLLASLAEGATEGELLADFPTVSSDGLRAVIAFAATSAAEYLPVPPVDGAPRNGAWCQAGRSMTASTILTALTAAATLWTRKM